MILTCLLDWKLGGVAIDHSEPRHFNANWEAHSPVLSMAYVSDNDRPAAVRLLLEGLHGHAEVDGHERLREGICPLGGAVGDNAPLASAHVVQVEELLDGGAPRVAPVVTGPGGLRVWVRGKSNRTGPERGQVERTGSGQVERAGNIDGRECEELSSTERRWKELKRSKEESVLR